VADLINFYLQESAVHLQAIKAAVTKGNANALEYEAHTLKSSSAALGAKSIANLCQELELMGFTGAIEGALEKFLQLEAEYETLKSALQIKRHQI
jgi:HPt (histidine-containing phosphotransfer) domain-containing protein